MDGTTWLEDFLEGQHFTSTDEIEVTAPAIIAFAQEYDPQPGHLSEEPARRTPFASLAASGWQTAAWTMKLFVSLGFSGLVGAGITLAWPTPTRPGDRLRLELRVTGVRPSRTKPDRGVVEFQYDTLNQADEIRQQTRAVAIAWRRPAPDSSPHSGE